MKKTYVYMFVDALGWEIVSKYNFLKDSLVYRKKVEMQFGYSSAAVPTILSGKYPQEHKHFSFFYYCTRKTKIYTKLFGLIFDNSRFVGMLSRTGAPSFAPFAAAACLHPPQPLGRL